MQETPLESIDSWSKDHLARMKEAWITTAEQVVALGASEEGMVSIAEQLSVSKEEAHKLVEAAGAKLSPDVRKAISDPVDTTDYGLGALPSDKKDR